MIDYTAYELGPRLLLAPLVSLAPTTRYRPTDITQSYKIRRAAPPHAATTRQSFRNSHELGRYWISAELLYNFMWLSPQSYTASLLYAYICIFDQHHHQRYVQLTVIVSTCGIPTTPLPLATTFLKKAGKNSNRLKWLFPNYHLMKPVTLAELSPKCIEPRQPDFRFVKLFLYQL